MIERMQPECPPDAHKVIRPPENPLNAILCVHVKDDSDIKKYGDHDFCQALALMSNKPLVWCPKEVEDAVIALADEYKIEPGFLRVHDDGTASIAYPYGSVSECYSFIDMAQDFHNYKDFLEKLSDKCIITVDALSMLILRSISTVYPWDKLLAGDFIRQYLKAHENISAEDIELLRDIRYGRVEALDIKESKPLAYQFLKLERKLFLQYPTED